MKENAEQNQQTSIANAMHALKLTLLRQKNQGIADRWGISPDMVLSGGIPLKHGMPVKIQNDQRRCYNTGASQEIQPEPGVKIEKGEPVTIQTGNRTITPIFGQ